MKKLISLFSALLVGITLFLLPSSCAPKADITVAVIQYGRFDALDNANRGFCDKLGDWAQKNGKTINFVQSNAGGESGNVAPTVNGALAYDPDLILAIATPVAVAAAGATSSVPVLYTAVTDPKEVALTGRNNIYGSSDMQPVAKQIDLIKDLIPSAEKVAFIFSSEEPNSRTQIDIAEEECRAIGLNFEEKSITDVNSIAAVVNSVSPDADAIYIPTDNTLSANLGTVVSANSRNLPIIVGESGMLSNGGWATLSLDYYSLGVQTAEIAIKLLSDENIAEADRHQLFRGAMTFEITDEAKKALGLSDESVSALGEKYFSAH
ncbi:MAG: ABC transporter substrate-binding protein [Clostridia bacterium]|nr:ABC transporter substrate-binding protein [Clostridia bacterium]